MADDEYDLGAALDAIRLDLGLQWVEVSARSGVSLKTLDRIRKGGGKALTHRKVEDVLSLERGSLSAGRPVPKKGATGPVVRPGPRPVDLVSDEDWDEWARRAVEVVPLVRKHISDRAADLAVAELLSEARRRGDRYSEALKKRL